MSLGHKAPRLARRSGESLVPVAWYKLLRDDHLMTGVVHRMKGEWKSRSRVPELSPQTHVVPLKMT